MTKFYKTIKQRIKDKHVPFLLSLSREVNTVFNYVNNLSYEHTRRTGKFFSAFDLSTYTKGCTDKDLGEFKFKIHSQTIQAINEEYVLRRKQFKKSKLNWRVSSQKSSRYSLGWIPFKSSGIKVEHGQVKYAGKWLSIFNSYKGSYDLNLYKDNIKSGCFVEDTRGRWYVCFVVEINSSNIDNQLQQQKHLNKNTNNTNTKSIGIDLGVKDFLTLSDGQNHQKIEGFKNYKKLEEQIAVAQRANKKDRVRALHIKIKNKRNDELHKLSTNLVYGNKNHNGYQNIFVGNVSSDSLVESNSKILQELKKKFRNKEISPEVYRIEKFKIKEMNKSAYDAGWSKFRDMLKYKSTYAGILNNIDNSSGSNFNNNKINYLEVDEKYTTQECSNCHALTGPKGRAGLGIRVWTCACGTSHDRDVNSAINILERGHALLAGGILVL